MSGYIQAFPGQREGMASTYQRGMHIRDWFAGMALQSLLAASESREGLADAAYEIADQMMVSRDREPDQTGSDA